MFQSSPGPKAGCYPPVATGLVRHTSVSILTRPEGRVLPPRPDAGAAAPTPGFNPHPARRPGATQCLSYGDIGPAWFQSSPGPKAGCYFRRSAFTACAFRVSILTRPEGRVLPPGQANRRCVMAHDRGFNPHPARRPGATRGKPGASRLARGGSILTRPEGRVLLEINESLANRMQVSILTRPEGRVLQSEFTASAPLR